MGNGDIDSTLGEFEIIERYFHRAAMPAGLRLGIGDDAAVFDAEGPIAVAVDMIVAGTHFPEAHPAAAVGHRVLAVNLSDLAAVGATPRWATLALALPAVDQTWLEGFAAGFFALADRFGVALIGGDTTRGPLTAAVQILGESAREPLRRSGGRIGDLVFVSGTLGDSAAGLELLARPDREENAAAAELIARFSYPEPRVDLGKALVGIAHSAIDVSDGLLADLGHIGRQSRCGAELDAAAVPLSSALQSEFAPERALALALTGGDDYELCFTAAASDGARIQAIAREHGVQVTEIGKLVANEGIRVMREGVQLPFDATGFVHF